MPDTPSAEPLLSYAFIGSPNPLQVGAAAELTLVVDNQTGDYVTCTQIVVTFPVGTTAEDLIADVDMTVVPPSNWNVDRSGGTITLTAPDGSIKIGRDGLTFAFTMTINAQVGLATVTIDETASDDTHSPATRSTTWNAAKFPIGFSLSELTAVSTDIAPGNPAQLMWTVAPADVTCTLAYNPTGSSLTTIENAELSDGIYTTDALTANDLVVFNLTAQVSGSDNVLQFTRQLTVSIQTLSVNLYAEPSIVGMNGLARLRWVSTNADHCIDQDGTTLPANGETYALFQSNKLFTISAVSADGSTVSAQATITMDPAIVATVPVAVTGANGANGNSYSLIYGHTTEGFPFVVPPTAGAPGADATLSQQFPPLEATDKLVQVIAIAVVAGKGGNGGDGYSYVGPAPAANGGNALLTLTWLPTSTSTAHYLIIVTAGAGGSGGTDGAAGTATATIDGQTLVLP